MRIGIIIAWVLLISVFLYAPYVNRLYVTKNYINIYTWADIFDINQLREFENQTGTKINLIYYDNCEELIAKLEITKGRACDLLFLADCSINDLIKMDLLALIDKTRLDFWQELEPVFLNKAYDLNNNYSIPYSWDIYGIGVNLEKFKDQLSDISWRLIFDFDLSFNNVEMFNNVGMIEDGLSAVSIASQYLYRDSVALNSSQVAQIKKLLVQQKQQVEAYTALRSDYLLSSGTCRAVVTQAACIYSVMQKNPKIKFLIPQEGGFVSTENFAIFKASNKQDMVYKFINFMFQKKVMHNYVNKTKFLPTRRDVLREINLDYIGSTDLLLSNISLAKIAFFTYMLPREDIMKLWMEVKAT